MSSRKIADIQILRAFAVSWVVIHHADDNLFRSGQLFGGRMLDYFGGWVGVDLFFAISGFVIARQLLPQLSGAVPEKQFWHCTLRFWGKRVLRLAPSAFSWLAIILLLQLFFNDGGFFGTLRANLWASLVAVLNVANVRYADSFMQYEYGVSFVYWSLSLEEQFYLILPLLILVFRKYLPWVLLLALAIQLPQQRGVWEMAFRSDAIIMGILIAMFSTMRTYDRFNPGNSFPLISIYTLVLVGCLVVLPFIGSFTQVQLPVQLGLVALISGLIVFFCSFDAHILARVPAANLMVWIGERSYAIYLIHIPAFYIVREAAHRMDIALGTNLLPVFAVSVIFILALADCNYRLIELPVQRHSRRIFGGSS